MCRKNSDHKKSVFGKGTKVFIGFLSAFVVYWLISAIHAAFILKKHNLSLIKAKSFDGILMEVLGFAFPVKTLVIGLVFGFEPQKIYRQSTHRSSARSSSLKTSSRRTCGKR